jgi:hypothetical protein
MPDMRKTASSNEYDKLWDAAAEAIRLIYGGKVVKAREALEKATGYTYKQGVAKKVNKKTPGKKTGKK